MKKLKLRGIKEFAKCDKSLSGRATTKPQPCDLDINLHYSTPETVMPGSTHLFKKECFLSFCLARKKITTSKKCNGKPTLLN